MPLKIGLVFATHKLSHGIFHRFAKIDVPADWDKILFVDNIVGDATIAQFRSQLPAGCIIESFSFGDHVLNAGYKPILPTLTPGSNHFPTIELIIKANLDRVWHMEYDVTFNGNWLDFFLAHENSKAAFLTARIKRQSNSPRWYWWKTLNAPVPLGPLYRIRSFNPLYRITYPAAKVLAEMYRTGWLGHHEVTMATCLHFAGFRIEDFGDFGDFTQANNRGLWYSPLTLSWKAPPFNNSLWTRKMLIHPLRCV